MLSFLLEELGNFGLEQCFFYRKAGNSAAVTWNFLFGFISNTSVLLGGASLADRLSYLFFFPLWLPVTAEEQSCSVFVPSYLLQLG